MLRGALPRLCAVFSLRHGVWREGTTIQLGIVARVDDPHPALADGLQEDTGRSVSPSAEGSLAAQGRGPGQYVVVLKDEKESAWGKDVPVAVQALETRHVVVKAEKTYQHALRSFQS
jgi:hypothetical protein